MTSILVSRHLKTTEDLHDSRPSPRTEALAGSAVQWADHEKDRWTFANSADDKRWRELRRNSDFGVAAGDGRKRPDGDTRRPKL